MKTRVLKFVTVFCLTVTLVVSFFAVPVAAYTNNNGVLSETLVYPIRQGATYDPVYFYSEWDDLDSDFLSGHSAIDYIYDEIGADFTFNLDGNYANQDDQLPIVFSVPIGRFNFDSNIGSSNYLWTSPFEIYISVEPYYQQTINFNSYRLSVRPDDGEPLEVYGFSDWYEISSPNLYSFYESIPSIRITDWIRQYNNDDPWSGLVLCFEFDIVVEDNEPQMNLRSFIPNGSVVVNYSATNSSSVPTFNPPSGEDILDENQTLEQDILNSDTVQDLESNTEELFSSLDGSLLHFRDGISFVTRCMNLYLVQVEDDDRWFHDLVQISLALGIVATLLGITGSIIGAAVKRRGD